MDQNNGIGYRGYIPWHLSSDLKRFRKITQGHHVLMGRKTYQSIGKPLPDRVNLVVSRTSGFTAPGCEVFDSIPKAVRYAHEAGEDELFVIGGAEIYQHIFPDAHKIYLTKVLATCLTDRKFPAFNEADWIKCQDFFVPAGEKDDYDTCFQVFQRINE